MASTTPRLVYSEDVVEHPTNRDVIGVVLQNALSSDDELSSSDEEEQLEKGHCVVAWYPKGVEEEIEESKLKIVDRSLLPGDVIRWIDPNKPQQKGYIKSVSVKVDLRVTGTNYMISNIDCCKLKPLQELFTGLVVVDGPWMGIIREVYSAVVLRLKNGSRCAVRGESVNVLVDTTDQRDEDSPFYCFGFYPGQHVYGPAKVFKEAEWISGTRPILGNNQRIRAVVEEASVSQLNVDWQVCGYVGDLVDESPSTPNYTVEGSDIDRLKRLNHFREASIQVGDKAFYTLSDDDVAAYWQYINKGKSQPSVDDDGVQQCKNVTMPTGSVSHDLSHLQSSAIPNEASGFSADGATASREPQASSSEGSAEEEDRDEHRSAPATHVSSRRSESRHGATLGPSRGHQGRRRRHMLRRKRKKQIVLKIASGEKVCCEVCRTRTLVSVVWQDGNEEKLIPSTAVIPVLHLDELEFFPGDFVVDKRADADGNLIGVVKSANSQERICQVYWIAKPGSMDEQKERSLETLSVYDIADHSDYNFRPGDCVVQLEGAERTKQKNDQENIIENPGVIGQVIHVTPEGEVQVIWSDGKISALPCHHIFVVHREDDEEGADGSSDSDFDSDSDEWETASDTSEDANIEQHVDLLEDIIMRSLAAFGNSNTNQNANLPQETNSSQAQASVDIATQPSDSTDVTMGTSQTVSSTPAGEGTESLRDLASCSDTSQLETSEHFTFRECAQQSHRFYANPISPTNPRQFSAVIRRELKLLQSSQTSGIYVCAYEDRLDLFSILIEGPPGTPYEGGLFAFDLQLADNYPKSPPSVYYISYCNGRLNPNLYEDGKVCVSLLGTWTGRGTETWTPKSNLCQVVLSLQGLILCEEPYYNEAGYEKHKGTDEGQENSRMYNEMVLIRLLQSIEGMLKNPPAAFQDQVYRHFRQNLPRLIEKFRTWVKVYGPNGSCAASSNTDVEFPLFPLSHGFCLTLERTLDRLESVMKQFLS